jgi:hypothetical protein
MYRNTHPSSNTKPCGSWLASDESATFNIDIACTTAIAGKPAPTVFAVFV